MTTGEKGNDNFSPFVIFGLDPKIQIFAGWIPIFMGMTEKEKVNDTFGERGVGYWDWVRVDNLNRVVIIMLKLNISQDCRLEKVSPAQER